MKMFKCTVLIVMGLIFTTVSNAQQTDLPDLLTDEELRRTHYLPDFSYAGYHFGEKTPPTQFTHRLNVTDFGAIPDDQVDDSQAFVDALKKAEELEGLVLIKIPAGQFNITKIIYINRSKTILRGAGTGEKGTVLYFPRPLRFVPDPPENEELRKYIQQFNKIQKEPENGVFNYFSQYSWAGGFLWVTKKGTVHKSYGIEGHEQTWNTLAKATSGQRGNFKIQVEDASKIKVGETYKLCWYNKAGKNGSLLRHMYDQQQVKIGSRHWENPDIPLVTQIVQVTGVDKNVVIIKDPLLYDIKTDWHCALTEWEHLEEVGIEHIAFEFPLSPDWPHHLEDGYNGLFLTGLMNGWVKNVRFFNADSGILTDDIANVTIEHVYTHGDKTAHYSVAMGEVHNVLVKGLLAENKIRHPISFNTRSTKCVYTDCTIKRQPILDQHNGANAQNLFDNIKVYVDAPLQANPQYGLFASGGASVWAPAHGAFNTFFNIEINFANLPDKPEKPILLNGVKQGVSARLIGVHANHPVDIDYTPNAYIEGTNKKPSVNSLYLYQLEKRQRKMKE